MKLLKTLPSIAVAMLLVANAAGAANVGEKAPDFTLTDVNGKEHSLADYEGKVVVLEWTNYGCPYVKNHYNTGNMQKLQGEMKEKDVVWLTICSSSSGAQGHMSNAKWKSESEKRGVASKAILIDDDGKVGMAYGAQVTPHMYVIDKDGTLMYNGAIDSIASTKAKDIEKAENYVSAAVDAVLAGKPVAKSVSKPYGCGIKYPKQST